MHPPVLRVHVFRRNPRMRHLVHDFIHMDSTYLLMELGAEDSCFTSAAIVSLQSSVFIAVDMLDLSSLSYVELIYQKEESACMLYLDLIDPSEPELSFQLSIEFPDLTASKAASLSEAFNQMRYNLHVDLHGRSDWRVSNSNFYFLIYLRNTLTNLKMEWSKSSPLRLF